MELLNGGVVSLNINDDNDLPLEPEQSQKTDSLKSDPSGAFIADFCDGYSFRQSINFIRQCTSDDCTFITRKDGIYCANSNDTKNITVIFNIYKYQLTKYEHDANTGTILLPVKLSELSAVLSKITKTMGIRIYKTSKNRDLYYQSIKDSNVLSDNALGILTLNPTSTFKDFKISDYNRSSLDPNCVVSSQDLKGVCNEIKTSGCSKVKLGVFPRGICFSTIMEPNARFITRKFGVVDESASENATPSLCHLPGSVVNNHQMSSLAIINMKPRNLVEEYYFYSTFMDTMALLDNINPRGVVKFYAETNKPLKVVSNVGDYGEMTIYIIKL